MPDDPAIQWKLATPFGILIDEKNDVWHSGHVDDILEFPDRSAILIATESGGVYAIDADAVADPVQLSSTWNTPDVKSLALGPDGPRHVFAGCTLAYDSDRKRSYKTETGSAPVIMETDAAQLAPLLTWNPVTGALPVTAGRITRIVVIAHLRRIIVACAAHIPPDTGGIFWAVIPPTRFSAGDPPRAAYVWKQAQVIGAPAAQGFWDLAAAATRDDTSRDNLEDRQTITLVAGGYGGGGLLFGQWNAADELVFNRSSLAFDNGEDATSLVFDSCGTSSVGSCELHPTVVYAACAWPDGRLNSVLRSKDGGRNWLFCGAQNSGGTGPLDLINKLTGDQGADWNNCIAVHPVNPGIAALGWVAGPFLTFDAGTTWILANGGGHLHADLHALRFSAETSGSAGSLLIGSDGGVAKIDMDHITAEHGQAFRSNYNKRLPALQCYSTLYRQFTGSIDASASPSGIVMAGLQDNGNVTCRFRPPEAWGHVDFADGGWNAVVQGGYVHNILDGAVIATAPLGPAVQVATIPVTVPAPGNPAGIKAFVGEPVMRPTHQNPAGQLLVAVASEISSNIVFGLYTDDPAVVPPYHWESIGAVPDTETVSALGSFGGDDVFVGTGQGGMYRLDVASGNVTKQTVSLPKPSPSTVMQGGSFSRIVGFGGASMFATLIGASQAKRDGSKLPGTPIVQGYVMRLDGETWTTTAGTGLPNEYLYGFVAVAAPGTRVPRALLAATDDAVYISREEGETWQRASSGLPRRAHCGDLRFVIDSLGRMDVFLGTFGWSVWVAELN